MNATIATLRAITAVTARRILTPVIWTVAIGLLLLYLGCFYLITQASSLWALGLIILIPLSFIVLALSFGLWWGSGKLFPSSYDKSHRKEIISFTDKLMRLIEKGKTPYPMHLLLIGKDVIRGKESSHLRSVIDDSSSLRNDFETLRQKF